ncbi:MAG TPA: DUF3093 domain-containing protein [Actinomycetes bacterium]|nr:DUF3093 domain-containing protein [Actinomycetes bacterium]
MEAQDADRYAESMPPPWPAWLAALVVAATFGIAVGAALGGAAGWAATVVFVGGTAAFLAWATGRVSVTDGELRAGRARLPEWARGQAQALDAEQARRLRGVDADPRAYLYLRSWVPTAVRVEVTDPADPAPYWYVSTRHPDRLADVLERGRGAHGRETA